MKFELSQIKPDGTEEKIQFNSLQKICSHTGMKYTYVSKLSSGHLTNPTYKITKIESLNKNWLKEYMTDERRQNIINKNHSIYTCETCEKDMPYHSRAFHINKYHKNN